MANSILASALLTATLFTAPVGTLVLTSGERIPVKGDITTRDATALFHRPNGSLYSLPLNEIDLAATQRLADESEARLLQKSADQARLAAAAKKEAETAVPLRIRVTDEQKQRLLSQLEKSRGAPGAINQPRPLLPVSKEARAAGDEVQVTRKNDEWYWRDQARRLEESVRQRKEELVLLVEKEQRLNDNILGLLSLGYKSQQFSYQVIQLEQVRDQLVYARLDVTRAERAYDQFRDDARRQGILPGWLR